MTPGKKAGVAALAAAVVLVGWQAWSEAPETAVRAIAGAEVAHLLTPNQIEELGLAPQAGEFDVSAQGNVLLLAGGVIYEVETSSRAVAAAQLTAEAAGIQSFALDRGDAILTIANQHFGQVEGDRLPSQAFPLPSAGMRVAASMTPGRVYLFGGRGLGARRLYLLGEEGGITVLAELPEDVVAVADSGAAVYAVTASNTVFRITPKETTIRFAAQADSLGGPIESLAVSEDDKTLFFSTAGQVFALRGIMALTVVGDAGGALRWRNDRLFVWDQRRGLVISLGALSRVIGGS